MPTVPQQLKSSGDLRGVSLDDLVGMSTALADLEFVAANNFCGCPHNVDDEIADADVGKLESTLGMPHDQCEGVKQAHARMRSAEAGSGSYPAGCNPDYPGLHAVAYYDNPSDRPPQLRRKMTQEEFQGIIDARVWGPSGDHNGRPFTMKELTDEFGDMEMGDVVNIFCEEMYRRIGAILYQVFTGTNGQHNIHVSYPVIPGGTIGVGWFPGSNPCPGDHVNLHIDKTYPAGFQGQFGLKGHEFGHTMQAPHQFSGQERHQEPMSYRYRNHLCVGYSNGDAVFGLPRAPSMGLWERIYDGVPVGVPWKGRFENTPTDPDDPPPSNTISGIPNGVFMLDGKLRKILVQ